MLAIPQNLVLHGVASGLHRAHYCSCAHIDPTPLSTRLVQYASSVCDCATPQPASEVQILQEVWPVQDALDALVDVREYDVPYHMRFQIDTDVRCGHWFTVTAKVGLLAGAGVDKLSKPSWCASVGALNVPSW